MNIAVTIHTRHSNVNKTNDEDDDRDAMCRHVINFYR